MAVKFVPVLGAHCVRRQTAVRFACQIYRYKHRPSTVSNQAVLKDCWSGYGV